MDYTYTFQPGTKAVAQQVNKNFDDAKQAIDSLEVDVSNIETQLTGGFVLPDGSVDFTKNQSYKKVSITGATYATPIVITANNHPYVSGDNVIISGVLGNTAANGKWIVTRVDANNFMLDNSAGNGTYTSGGTAYRAPSSSENLVDKAYTDYMDAQYDDVVDFGARANENIQLPNRKMSKVYANGILGIIAPTSTGKADYSFLFFSSAINNPLVLYGFAGWVNNYPHPINANVEYLLKTYRNPKNGGWYLTIEGNGSM